MYPLFKNTFASIKIIIIIMGTLTNIDEGQRQFGGAVVQ